MRSPRVFITSANNRRGRRGIRRGTRRGSSLLSAKTSAASAVKIVLIFAIFGLTAGSSIAQQPPEQDAKVPAIAVDYRADAKRPMPPLNRVGVDTTEQQPLTLRDAIAQALRNNKDIEVARDNVKI